MPKHRLANLHGIYTIFLPLQILLLLHLQTNSLIYNSVTRSLERALQVIGKSFLSAMPVLMPEPMPKKIQTRRKTTAPFRPAKRSNRIYSTPIPRSKFILNVSLNKRLSNVSCSLQMNKDHSSKKYGAFVVEKTTASWFSVNIHNVTLNGSIWTVLEWKAKIFQLEVGTAQTAVFFWNRNELKLVKSSFWHWKKTEFFRIVVLISRNKFISSHNHFLSWY